MEIKCASNVASVMVWSSGDDFFICSEVGKAGDDTLSLPTIAEVTELSFSMVVGGISNQSITASDWYR